MKTRKIRLDILQSAVFQDAELFKAFIWCLLKANDQPEADRCGFGCSKIPRGSFTVKIEDASTELNWTEEVVEQRMRKLDQLGLIRMSWLDCHTIIDFEEYFCQ